MTDRLAGDTALVTGAGQGIGAAIARRFAAEGAAVACLDIARPGADETAAGITAAGGRAVAMVADIAAPETVEAALAALPADWDRIGVLVANAAAVTRPMPLAELPLEDWSRAVAVNLTGTFVTVRSVLPRMAAGGRVILVASQLGSVAQPGRGAYCATKAAVLQLGRVLALELAEAGLRVNTLSPGPVWTERLAAFHPDRGAAEAVHAPAVPLGRLGEPVEIAEAALFLADPANGFMTGADLVVDGGYLAR